MLLGLNELQDRVDAFLFGSFYKATRIDDSDVSGRALGIVYTMIALLLEAPHELFRVYEVF